MKKRFQITVGPATQKTVKQMAAKFRKETGSEWTEVDVLESMATHGLKMLGTRFQMELKPLQTVRD